MSTDKPVQLSRKTGMPVNEEDDEGDDDGDGDGDMVKMIRFCAFDDTIDTHTMTSSHSTIVVPAPTRGIIT